MAATTTTTHAHFNEVEEQLDGYNLYFVLQNVPLCIANGIRRFTMNAIPIGGFRDEPPSVTGPNRSITINQNHSLLYNEMIVTRIAMLPIKQKALPRILSKWDDEEKVRKFYFERNDTIPVASFSIKSSDQKPGLYDITTKSIQVETLEEKKPIDTDALFVHDLVTGEPILLHCLMFPYPSVDVPLAFTARPVIGTGRENSSFTPVGTTSMRFVEDEERVEHVLKNWMNEKAKERTSKGLAPLSEEELDIMRKNFYLLEKQRIYKQDAHGPSHIALRIESLGSMKSKEIMRESLRMLATHSNDLSHTLKESFVTMPQQNLVEISIGKVDHTIPQCIVECWKKMPFATQFGLPSYRLTHPLKEEMILSFHLLDPTNVPKPSEVISHIKSCIAVIIDDISYLLEEFEGKTDMSDTLTHSVSMDDPSRWKWMESIPPTEVSILPKRPPRSTWKIAASLLRTGS